MDSILYNDIRVPVILDRPLYTGKSIKEVYSNLNITHVIGSSTPIVDGSSDTIVELYSILTKTLEITLTPNIPYRSDHSMVAISNDIYIYGGSSGGVLNDFYKIDTLTCNPIKIETPTIDSIVSRSEHNMVAINNDIYIYGGRYSTTYFDDFYKIDTLTCNAIKIETATIASIGSRYIHGMVAISNYIYIFGGVNGSATSNTFYKIDTTTCNATQMNLTPVNTPVNSISAKDMRSMVAIKNDIYIWWTL